MSAEELAELEAAFPESSLPPPIATSDDSIASPGAPIRTTYSFWNAFRNCRKSNEWRYIRDLVPLERDRNLSFGTLIHRALEIWHRERNLAPVLDFIDRLLPNREADERQKRDWHLATAIMRGYAVRYSREEFEVVELEKVFEGPIVNPATGAASRTFVLAGKVDGIVRIDGRYYLLEHKTAAQIDGSYLEKLWTDLQITLYSHYIEQVFGIAIAGVVYNILGKTRLEQHAGETEEEFEERRSALIAKSKTGKSSAKRRMPETDDEFRARLDEKYTDPGMFHREVLYLSREQVDAIRAELWELTQAYLEARRRGVFYQNTSYCFQYRRPCAYFALCRSGGNPTVLETFYERRPPNEELLPESPLDDAPAF